MHSKKKMNWKVASAVIAAAVVFGIGLYYFYFATGRIYEYDPARDREDIITSFEHNRYWLSETLGYSIEYALDERAPDKSKLYRGKMHIKVLRENSSFAGFVAYYMLRSDLGKILFLLVDSAFRGKRYGETLTRRAMGELEAMGAKDITLITRAANYPAQRVYDSIGFKRLFEDEGFVYYSYSLRK